MHISTEGHESKMNLIPPVLAAVFYFFLYLILSVYFIYLEGSKTVYLSDLDLCRDPNFRWVCLESNESDFCRGLRGVSSGFGILESFSFCINCANNSELDFDIYFFLVSSSKIPKWAWSKALYYALKPFIADLYTVPGVCKDSKGK